LAEKAYLKSDLSFLGVPLPAMRQLIKTIRRPPALDRDALLQLVRTLWGRSVFELRMVAVLLLEAFEPLLRPADIRLLERLIRESKTWAFVDALAIAIIGPLGFLGATFGAAGAAATVASRRRQLRAIRPLCGPDARRARVLHS